MQEKKGAKLFRWHAEKWTILEKESQRIFENV